jgi:predicted RNA-binding protein with PIN domain
MREAMERTKAERREGWLRFGREVALAFAIVAAFTAVGLGWAAAASRMRGAREAAVTIAYDPSAMAAREPRIWLVDGYNVLHAGVLGGRDRAQWWTEARRRELVERVAGFARDAEVWIVFDGADERGSEADPPGPRCVFSASADDWLVERVRSAEDPSAIAVVTGDRQVAERSRGSGARVVSPKEFLERCAT